MEFLVNCNNDMKLNPISAVKIKLMKLKAIKAMKQGGK